MSPDLRKNTYEQPCNGPLTNRPRPRFRGGTPAFSLDVDNGWINHGRFVAGLAPRLTSPVVIGVGICYGIFVGLHGSAMGGDVLG